MAAAADVLLLLSLLLLTITGTVFLGAVHDIAQALVVIMLGFYWLYQYFQASVRQVGARTCTMYGVP